MKTDPRQKKALLEQTVTPQSGLQSRPFKSEQAAAGSAQAVQRSPSFSFGDINVMRQPTATSLSPDGSIAQFSAPALVPPGLNPQAPILQRSATPNTLQRVIETRTDKFIETDDLFLDWQERLLGLNVFESFEVTNYINQIEKGTISDSFEEIRLRLETDFQPESVINKLIEDLKAVSGTEKEAPVHYYSHADRSIEIDKDHAAITAMKTGSGYGHTRIYIELLDGGQPRTVCTDLIVVSYEEKDKDDKVVVNITEMQTDSNLEKYLSNQNKKTWAISQGQALKALKKANTVQTDAKDDKYLYSRHGGRDVTNLFSSKKLVNCARYGVKILKAAGVEEARAGKVFRLPSSLVS